MALTLFPSFSTSPSPRTTRERTGRRGERGAQRGMKRLSGPLSRNTDVNHDFIADNFTRSRARRHRRYRRHRRRRRRRRRQRRRRRVSYFKLVIAPLAQERAKLVAPRKIVSETAERGDPRQILSGKRREKRFLVSHADEKRS